MITLKQSSLAALTSPANFLWASGIEDTFITYPWAATGRTLDEYELTLHYERWREDIALFSDLGVRAVRYGLPWHRINPAPGKWDWSFADAVLDELLGRGIQPIVDLVHYGLPGWIEGAYGHPDFPDYMAEFAGQVARRYRDRIFCYTPLNEPRVTAWYCGRLGWWPPARRGWKGFVSVMLAVCRGIVQTAQALKAVDPEILLAHVDATDLYETEDTGLAEEVGRRQEIVFLALDLVSGRVRPDHRLYQWLLGKDATKEDLNWFSRNAVSLDLIGINLYPLFSRKLLKRSAGGLRIRMPYADADIVDRLAAMYWERYRAPVWISETASQGSVRVRQKWLHDSVAAVARVRHSGIPLVGYTWWPLFALVTWAYRQGRNPPESYLRQMGLWNLEDAVSGQKMARVPTPLVREFKDLVMGGAPGPLSLKEAS